MLDKIDTIIVIIKGFLFDLRYNWIIGYYPSLPLKERFTFRWDKRFLPFVILFRLIKQQEKYSVYLEQQLGFLRSKRKNEK